MDKYGVTSRQRGGSSSLNQNPALDLDFNRMNNHEQQSRSGIESTEPSPIMPHSPPIEIPMQSSTAMGNVPFSATTTGLDHQEGPDNVFRRKSYWLPDDAMLECEATRGRARGGAGGGASRVEVSYYSKTMLARVQCVCFQLVTTQFCIRAS